jgi:type II secretory pathway pseudopilin PulG
MKRRSGFTLAEVLVTLLFLAIVLPVAMRGVSLSLAAASNAKHTREATALAENKLTELTMLSNYSSGQSGDFAPEHPEYRWSCQVSSGDYSVSQIDLRIIWEDRGQERSLVFSTLLNPDTITSTSGTSTAGATP